MVKDHVSPCVHVHHGKFTTSWLVAVRFGPDIKPDEASAFCKTVRGRFGDLWCDSSDEAEALAIKIAEWLRGLGDGKMTVHIDG